MAARRLSAVSSERSSDSKFLLLPLLLLLTSCTRYSDFTLPPLPGGDPTATYTFEEHPSPVIERGQYSDVLNPSVIYTGNYYRNYYSVFDGRTWHTAKATSDDGLQWNNEGLILSPDPTTWEGSYIAANGSLLPLGGHWYVAGPRNRPAIGQDVRGRPRVLKPGPWSSWDEYGVADPYVINIADTLYMYYLGQDRAWRQRIGLARSTDYFHWQKLRTPILEADENIGEPAVWQARNFYWMLYTVRLPGEIRHLRLARSSDGVHWDKLPLEIAGSQPWDSQVICDPTVIATDDLVQVWFGGGDVARPDEGIHGQIGFGVLHPASDTLKK